MTDFQPGDVVDGRYALEERIGLGGMAAVWRAKDRGAADAVVAVKILREDFLRRNPKEAENNVRRFRREAEILKLLAGAKHVVQAKASGTTAAGDHYLVMELLEGEPLRGKIRRGRQAMGLRTFAWLGRGLVAGLGEIHAKGVIHRDLSPDNIFVTRDAEGLPLAKFLDFGIGKGADGKLDQVTQLVTIMGKPQYFSPEQARGAELSNASDVFSLAVILYEMASGALPIDLKGAPLVAAVKRILQDPPIDLATLPEGARLPESMRALILKGMAKKAEDRPPLEAFEAEFASFAARLEAGESFDSGASADRAGTAASEVVVAPDATPPETSAEASSSVSSVVYREFKPGEELGRFQVKKRVGRGGMGEVYRAWDTVLHRDVAIKVASKVEGDTAVKSVLREARASSRLRSENIVTVYDAGVHAGLPYIVMEFVEGRTLADLLEEEGPCVGVKFWGYASGMCDGLAFAHAHDPKIVHKDLKPGNILIAGDVAKIADFGLASFTAGGQKGESQLAGAAHGSVHTMSPEQAEGGRPVDERSDVYSMGCVFYMMTTGAPPFDGNEIAVLYQHQTQAPEPPSKRNPAFEPPELEPVILKCLEKDPAKRYADARALRAALEEVFAPYVGSQAKRWRTRTKIAAAAAVLLAVVALGLVWIKTQRATRGFGLQRVGGEDYKAEAVEPYFTSEPSFHVQYSAPSGGVLVVRIAEQGGTGDPVEREVAIEQSDGTGLLVELPPPTGTAAATTYAVELRRKDNPATLKEFKIVHDRTAPEISVATYGVARPADGGPIPVLDWADARIAAKDDTGFRGRAETELVVDDLTKFRQDDHFAVIVAPKVATEDERSAEIKAKDRAERTTARVVRLVRAALAATAEPADGAATAGTPLRTTFAFATSPAIEGFDAARDLKDAKVVAFVGDWDRGARKGPEAALAFKDGRAVADVAPPPPAPGSKEPFVYELALTKNGRRLRLGRASADGSPTAAGPRCVFDPLPPRVVATVDATTLASDDAGGPAAEIVLRGPGAARDRVGLRFLDAPPAGGVAGPVVATIAFDDGPARPLEIAPDGTARLPESSSEPGRATIVARDAAGNATTWPLTFVRRLQRVASIKVGNKDVPAGGANGSPSEVHVASAQPEVFVTAENLAADDRLYVRVDDAPDRPSTAAPAPMAARDGGFAAVAALRTQGAPVCVRDVVVLAGVGAAAPAEVLARVRVVFDGAAPRVAAALEGGAALECGAELASPVARRIVVTFDDGAGGSGFAPDEASRAVTVEGPATAEVAPSVDGGSTAFVVTVAPEAGGADVARTVKVTCRATDRAGNASKDCVVVLKIKPRPVKVVSFAGDATFGVGGDRLATRKAVRAAALETKIACDADFAGWELVLRTYRQGAAAEDFVEKSLNLRGAADKDGQTYLFEIPAPAGDAPIEGRTIYLLKEPGAALPLEEPVHEVRWKLDRGAPKILRLLRDGTPVDDAEVARGVKVARLSSLEAEVEDDGGFGPDPVGAGDGAAWEVLPASTERRIRLRAKEDARGGDRRVRLVVRDAAGNEAERAFDVSAARAEPVLARDRGVFTAGVAAGEPGVDRLLNAPRATLVVQNDTVDATGVVAQVFDAAGAVVHETAVEPLPAGAKTLEVAWRADAYGRYKIALTHYRGDRGKADRPFAETTCLVDPTPPVLVVRKGGADLAGDDAGTLDSAGELEFVATDAGSGVKSEALSASVVEPANEGLLVDVVDVAPAPGGAEARFRLKLTGTPKDDRPVVVEVDAIDRAGGRAKTRRVAFRLNVATASPTGPAKVAKRLADYAPAEVAAALADVKRRTGVDLVPISDAGGVVFYLARTEATNAQMARFADALADPATQEQVRAILKRPPPRPEEVRRAVRPGAPDDAPAHPVSEAAAAAFAAWADGALPTFDEWRNAAGRFRQPSANFPLKADGSPGSSRDTSFAWFDASPQAPRAVGELAEGLFGLRGMAGNVAEWVLYGPGDRRSGVAGGSFRSPPSDYADCLQRNPNNETDASVRQSAGVRVRWPAER